MKNNLFILCFLFCMRLASAQNITTYAGSSLASGFSGDNGLAVSAKLSGPFAVAVDPAGNVYIADRFNNRIRKVDGAGIITTVAGNGIAGYTGDGGPATNASLNGPTGVAADGHGNIYIADQLNNCVRKVNAGVITTLAGTDTLGYRGDGGAATAALLNGPRGVAVDAAGNVYVSDQGNNRVREITAAGIIGTIAGNGTAGFSGDDHPATNAMLQNPAGIAVDTSGNVYIADVDNERIRKVTVAGIITTVAGSGVGGFSGDGGPATAAKLSEPIGVSLDAHNNLYIADGWNFRIRRVNTTGTIYTIAGNGTNGFTGDGGPATAAELNDPYGVAVDVSGNIYIADYINDRIRYVTAVLGVPSITTMEDKMSLFPNPASNTLNISTAQTQGTIVITDITGKNILQKGIYSNTTTIDLYSVPRGVYFATWNYNGQAMATEQFIAE